jgi:geranylgeranyl diphosphate synthase type II
MHVLDLHSRRPPVTLNVEVTLTHAVDLATAPPCPPTLARALRYAVFPGGNRVRPKLLMEVARACGLAHPELACAGGAALEFLHCASLVHDDLPMFDDADERRGRPSVHRAFSQPIALLVGDALIVQAFDVVARAHGPADVALAIQRMLSTAAGGPRGIVAGQAWESEPHVDVAAYHRAKTAALFVGAVTIGALAGGGDAAAWTTVGVRIGEAYQVADDLADVLCSREAMGKPTGRDVALERPSVVRDLGVEGAERRLHALLSEAADAVPACVGGAEVVGTLRAIGTTLLKSVRMA